MVKHGTATGALLFAITQRELNECEPARELRGGGAPTSPKAVRAAAASARLGGGCGEKTWRRPNESRCAREGLGDASGERPCNAQRESPGG